MGLEQTNSVERNGHLYFLLQEYQELVLELQEIQVRNFLIQLI